MPQIRTTRLEVRKNNHSELATNFSKVQTQYICSAQNSMLYFHQTTSETGDEHGQERKSAALRHEHLRVSQRSDDRGSHRHPARCRSDPLLQLEV